MADVQPFRALRPRDDLAGEVIAPPYDVLTPAEARALAAAPHSFVRVTRAEATLAPGTDPHAPAAYARARENLAALLAAGALLEDAEPRYYLYGQVRGEHCQVGVLATCSVQEYLEGRIKRHEHTRPAKVEDRALHMETLDAQVGLVFLIHSPSEALRALVAQVTETAPAWRVTTEDAVQHALWPVPEARAAEVTAAFATMDALYVADGHHRTEAAARVHQARGTAESSRFLAGLFPSDSLEVLAYNRVVHDLGGHSPEDFLLALGEAWELELNGPPVPARAGEFSMYFGGQWLTLRPRPGVVDASDPVASLDASVLQTHLLGPLLGIDDPRSSERIDFLGGSRGPEALVAAVEEGSAVAFHLFPTRVDQLLAVADAGEVMPPKSTWFEPKLREGVVSRRLAPARPAEVASKPKASKPKAPKDPA